MAVAGMRFSCRVIALLPMGPRVKPVHSDTQQIATKAIIGSSGPGAPVDGPRRRDYFDRCPGRPWGLPVGSQGTFGTRAGDVTRLLEALDINRKVFGATHERVEATLRVLGDVVETEQRHTEALARYAEALDIVRATLGPQHDEVPVLRLRMARVHTAMGQAHKAEADFRAAVSGFRAAHGIKHYLTVDATLSFAEFLLDTGRAPEARPLLNDLVPVVAGLGPTFHKMADRIAAARARLPATSPAPATA